MPEHDPGLDAIMRTDRFVDALASGARMSSVDPLSSMLGAWRDDVRSRPDAQVVTLAQASAALADAQKPPRRNRFALTVVGTAAATLLSIGGFVAVVSDAKPGEALYGLRTMLFGETTHTREAAVSLASQELDQVQQLVQQGQWDQAQQKLVALSPTVQSVNDVQSKQQLVEQYNSLAAKVIQRDAEAAPPPPGVPPPVLPSAPLTFLPVPVIEATTTAPSTPPSVQTTTSPTIKLTTTTPLPTTTGPLPTATSSLPTPTSPSPAAKVPSPTPTSLPTAAAPLPTPTAPATSASAPPPILRETTTAASPPVTVTTSQAPAVASTVTTPSAATSSAASAPAPSAPKTTQSPATKKPSVVTTTPEEPANPQTGP